MCRSLWRGMSSRTTKAHPLQQSPHTSRSPLEPGKLQLLSCVSTFRFCQPRTPVLGCDRTANMVAFELATQLQRPYRAIPIRQLLAGARGGATSDSRRGHVICPCLVPYTQSTLKQPSTYHWTWASHTSTSAKIFETIIES